MRLTTCIAQVDFIGVGSWFVYSAPFVIHPSSDLPPPLRSHSIEIVLHSNLACRLVVGLREAGRSPQLTSDAFELSELTNDDTVVFAHGRRRSENSWMHVELEQPQAGPSQP